MVRILQLCTGVDEKHSGLLVKVIFFFSLLCQGLFFFFDNITKCRCSVTLLRYNDRIKDKFYIKTGLMMLSPSRL